MQTERLVRPIQNPKIKELDPIHRIEINHPILVRETVAKKLDQAASNLPEHLSLQIDSGYRSRESQQKLFQARVKQFGSKKKAEKLVFNPYKGVPPHTTGGAIDVSLLDQNGTEINLSDPLIKFYEEPQLYSEKISADAQAMRLMLHDLMLKQKFAPHPDEYWHFSYGEQLWAEHYKTEVIYDEIDADTVESYPYYFILLIKLRKIVSKVIRKVKQNHTSY